MLVRGQVALKQHVKAEELKELVADASDCSRTTAHNSIEEAIITRLISVEREGRNVYYYFNNEQVARIRNVNRLKRSIAKVIDIQCEHPTDGSARSHLLPPEVYYNIINYPSEEEENDR